MKEFINVDKMCETLIDLYTESIDNPEKYESYIEERAFGVALGIADDMRRYVHQKDTHMCGNFADIREDWDELPDFVDSEVKPFGKFDDVVRSIDDGTISDDDLQKFQTWCFDWFFTAFGTYGIRYNFQSDISDMEWEEEHYGNS